MSCRPRAEGRRTVLPAAHDVCGRAVHQELLVPNMSAGQTGNGAGATQQQPCPDECSTRWPELQQANPFYHREPVANVVSNSGQVLLFGALITVWATLRKRLSR
jgi:hypothetical protein